MKDKLSEDQKEAITGALKLRFVKNSRRHTGFEWAKIEKRLLSNPEKLWSLYEMERTGGEPDVFGSGSTDLENSWEPANWWRWASPGRFSKRFPPTNFQNRKRHL